MTPKIISNKKIISRLAVVGILVGGLVITIVLTALRTEPPRTERVNQAPLVSTLEVSARSGALTVTGTGSVQPTREVTLAAEVGGKVATVSPALVSGGTVTKGHVLATLVADDDTTTTEQADAFLEAARAVTFESRPGVSLGEGLHARSDELVATGISWGGHLLHLVCFAST